jgi:hypothetical protein
MENSQATPSIEYFYSRAIGKHLGVSGGSSCGCAEKKDFPTEGSVYGGADRLDKYANSIYSATKE